LIDKKAICHCLVFTKCSGGKTCSQILIAVEWTVILESRKSSSGSDYAFGNPFKH